MGQKSFSDNSSVRDTRGGTTCTVSLSGFVASEPTFSKIQPAVNEAAGDPQKRDSLPKLGYNREQAAEILGISCTTLDRLAARGLIRPSRALRRPIYSLAVLEKFLVETSVTLGQ